MDQPIGPESRFTKMYFAEAIVTFALDFVGTGAIVINDVSGGTVTHVSIASLLDSLSCQ